MTQKQLRKPRKPCSDALELEAKRLGWQIEEKMDDFLRLSRYGRSLRVFYTDTGTQVRVAYDGDREILGRGKLAAVLAVIRS